MAVGYKLATLARRVEKLETRRPKQDSFPRREVVLRGANEEVQTRTDKTLLLAGAAGTGKSTACLWKIYNLCLDNPRIRVAIVRKTRASLVETALVTFEQHILGYGHPLLNGATRQNRTSYVFPNNSRINIVGMDKPDRVLSSDYDLIYVCQAEELDTDDAEALLSRLRNNRLPFSQLLMDCNPQSKTHWLYQRFEQGKMTMLTSTHKDNPAYWDSLRDDWTPLGKDYIENTLGALSGVRYKRLALGLWEAAEGQIYETFDRAKHITKYLPPMRRTYAGTDWGHGDAGAMVLVGEGNDGILYVIEEHLQTGKTLDYWEAIARRWMKDYNCEKFFCDPSVTAHIHAFNVKKIPAVKAVNKIEFGIDVVQQRINTKRLKVFCESSKGQDRSLRDRHKPTTLVEEIESYTRHPETGVPIDKDNHALDALRYVVVGYDRPRADMTPITSTSRSMFRRPRTRGSLARSTNR